MYIPLLLCFFLPLTWCQYLMNSREVEYEARRLSVGLVLPHTVIRRRDYIRAMNKALQNTHQQKYSFLKVYHYNMENLHMEMFKENQGPTGKLCLTFGVCVDGEDFFRIFAQIFNH